MKKVVVLFLLFLVSFLYGYNEAGAFIAKKHSLIPGTKAAIQWKRVFESKRKLKKYGLENLSANELESLKQYLLDHAADSPKPIVPGL